VPADDRLDPATLLRLLWATSADTVDAATLASSRHRLVRAIADNETRLVTAAPASDGLHLAPAGSLHAPVAGRDGALICLHGAAP